MSRELQLAFLISVLVMSHTSGGPQTAPNQSPGADPTINHNPHPSANPTDSNPAIGTASSPASPTLPVTGVPLPLSLNPITPITGVPLFTIATATLPTVPTTVKATTPSPIASPSSNAGVAPHNPQTPNHETGSSKQFTVIPNENPNFTVLNSLKVNSTVNSLLDIIKDPSEKIATILQTDEFQVNNAEEDLTVHLLAELLKQTTSNIGSHSLTDLHNKPRSNMNTNLTSELHTNPIDQLSLNLISELLDNFGDTLSISDHSEVLADPNVNPNLNILVELLEGPTDVSLTEPAFDILNQPSSIAKLLHSTDSESSSTIDQISDSATSEEMTLLTKLLGILGERKNKNSVSNIRDSFHNPYVNPVTDPFSRPGVNIETQPAPDLLSRQIGQPLVNFLQNPLGRLFSKPKAKVNNKSRLSRILTKTNKKMESIGNLFGSLLSPTEFIDKETHPPDSVPLEQALEDIMRTRRKTVKTNLFDRIQSLRRVGDSSGERRKQFFGDCSSLDNSRCARSIVPRRKRSFLSIGKILKFVRTVLRIFGINIPDKLYNMMSSVLGVQETSNGTTTSQSSTENVVKSDVQYLIC